MKIFLSHDSNDKLLVTGFKDQLPSFLQFWLDAESLEWGGSLENSIRKAINDEVDFVIAFIGRDALASDWVKKELKWALESENDPRTPFILPILIDNLNAKEIPEFISGKRWLSLKSRDKEGLVALAKEAQEHLFRITARGWSRNRIQTPSSPPLETLNDQASVNEFIKQRIDPPDVEQATVVQYSSDMAKPAIEHLLNKGIAVDLYIMDPRNAISDFQGSKIETSMRTYLHHWENLDRESGMYGRLRIAFYRDIGTVRGFRFSNDSIIVGVYHYTKDVIWGHDIPAFYCPPNSENIEPVLKRFDRYVKQLDTSDLHDLAYYHDHGLPYGVAPFREK